MKKVSIVIPCRNEEKYIEKCLQSIVDCNYPKDKLEVFVCDGKSDDGTIKIIEAYGEQYPFIKLLINERRTTQYALNIGIKKSDADIKIILGAHSEINNEYINECLKAFEISNEIGCVGGVLDNVIEDNTTKVIAKAMSSSFGVGNAHFRTGNKNGYVDTVAFGAYKSEVFSSVGYFDEELVRNQDDEFNFRLLKHGYKIYLSKGIIAKYYVRASFGKLYRQYFQYGYWKVFVNKKHKTITTIRQLIPALFVSYIILGALLSMSFFFIFYYYLAILILYFTASLISATRIAGSIVETAQIMITFLILHISYGLGYVKGILDFVVLNKNPKESSKSLTR